jgi:hypothetical protein
MAKKPTKKTARKSKRYSPKTDLKFRSGIESTIADELTDEGISFNYEPVSGKIPYIIPASKHSYLPDFYITTRTGKEIIIEVKGIWVYADRYKHLLIRIANPDLDIRFVFSNSRNKIRKGSKTTYRDICEGRGKGLFKGQVWKYTDKTLDKEWLDE